MPTRPPTAPLCEVCARRPAVTVVVVQHLAVSVCGVCWLLAKAKVRGK